MADNSSENQETVTLEVSPSSQNLYLVGVPNIAELIVFDEIQDAISLEPLGTEISANPQDVTADGIEFSTATVQLKDDLGGNLPAEGIAVELTTTIGTLDPISGTTDSNGQFQATLTSLIAGITDITGE